MHYDGDRSFLGLLTYAEDSSSGVWHSDRVLFCCTSFPQVRSLRTFSMSCQTIMPNSFLNMGRFNNLFVSHDSHSVAGFEPDLGQWIEHSRTTFATYTSMHLAFTVEVARSSAKEDDYSVNYLCLLEGIKISRTCLKSTRSYPVNMRECTTGGSTADSTHLLANIRERTGSSKIQSCVQR